MSIVTFGDAETAKACDNRIDLLRHELSLPKQYKFHFHSNAKSVRLSFLDAIAPYEFFYHSFSLNKDPAKLYGRGFDFKGPLYKYVCGLVFENAKQFLVNATVVIDKSGDRLFRDQLAAYLRKRMNEGQRVLIRKIKMEESRTNNLLQLADYIAGVTNRYVTGRADAKDYRRFVVGRELTQRVWPRI